MKFKILLRILLFIACTPIHSLQPRIGASLEESGEEECYLQLCGLVTQGHMRVEETDHMHTKKNQENCSLLSAKVRNRGTVNLCFVL